MSFRLSAASLLFVLLLAAIGCRRRAEPEALPFLPAGPDIDIRLRTGERIALVLPPRVRISRLPLRAVIHDGPLSPGPDGRVEARAEDGRILIGTLREPGPLELTALPDPENEPQSLSSEGPFLGIPPDARALAVGTPSGPAPIRRYRGRFLLRLRDDELELSNRVSIEEYLAGVIGSEMVASTYPIDALKAQAVAARTYALIALRSAAEAGRELSFPPDQRFQVYGGIAAEHPRVTEAVLGTTGEILTWRGSIFRAYFHSTCGGRTANAWSFFDEPDIAPLRGVTCGACDDSRFFRWEARWKIADVAAVLARWLEPQGVSLGAIEEVRVSEIFPDGRVRYVRFAHAGGSFEIQAGRLRFLLRPLDGVGLRSTAFDVRIEGDSIVFVGSGWGHGVGLCQVGASRLGKTLGYREILARYYAESEVTKLY